MKKAEQTNILPFKQSTQYYLKKAGKAESSNRLLDALVYYRKANSIEPGNVSVLTAMADIYTDLEYFEESNACIYEALRQNPTYTEDLSFLMGCNFMGMSYLANADKCFKQYKKDNPNGEYAEEVNDYFDFLNNESLAKLSSDVSPQEMETYGKIYAARRMIVEKKEAESVKVYEEILQKDAKNTTVLNDLSLAYYALGEMKKAIACNLRVLDIEENNVAALSNLIVFYKTEGDEVSAKKYIKNLETAPMQSPDDYQKSAYILAWVGQYKQAYNCALDLLLFNPHDIYALHMSAVSAFNIGEFDEAVTYWTSIEKLQPSNEVAEYYLNKAKTAAESGSTEKLEYLFEIPMKAVEARIKQVTEALALTETKFLEEWNTADGFKAKMVWAMENLEGELYYSVVTSMLATHTQTAMAEVYRQLLNARLPRAEKRYLVKSLLKNGEEAPFFVDVDGKVETIEKPEDIAGKPKDKQV